MKNDDWDKLDLPIDSTPRAPLPKKALPTKKKTEEEVDLSGYNSSAISMLLELSKLPPIDYLNPDELHNRIYDFFNYCIEHNEKPTEQALCLAIGIDKNTYKEWLNGSTKYNREQQKEIRKAHQILEALSEKYLLDGKCYPASIIFYLKNNFGYKDTTERTIQIKDQYAEEDIDTIRQQYAEERKAVDVDIIDNDAK